MRQVDPTLSMGPATLIREPLVSGIDDSLKLISILREQLALERKEKERYRDLLYARLGLLDIPQDSTPQDEGVTEIPPGYTPWQKTREELEARHRELAYKAQEERSQKGS